MFALSGYCASPMLAEQLELHAADHVRLLERDGEPRGQLASQVFRDVRHERHEFVASRPADDVAGPETLLQPLRRDGQQLVADAVAILVVDLLEVR